MGRVLRSIREEGEGWAEQIGTCAGRLGAVKRRVRGGALNRQANG